MKSEEIIVLALPLFFTILAFLFKLFPPHKLNPLYGYRTQRSMASAENWKLANLYFARFYLRANLFFLFLIVGYYLIAKYSKALLVTEIFGLVGILCGAIIYTELKLRKNKI